jgi:phosphatidylserine decarboxylase
MTLRTAPKKVIDRITQQEQLNFLLTNRIPRRYATLLIGWLSKRENVIVRTILLTLWRIFSDLDLSEAKKRKFKSVHDCFTRELKDGARPVDMSEGGSRRACTTASTRRMTARSSR